MKLSDKTLTVATGVLLALGIGVAGVFLKPSGESALSVQAMTVEPDQIPAINTASPASSLTLPVVLASYQPAFKPQKPANVVSRAVQGQGRELISSPCAVQVHAQKKTLSRVLLSVVAACQPDRVVTIEHANLQFRNRLDENGRFSVLIPAFESDARFTVRMPDGQRVSTSVMVSGLQRLRRVAVSGDLTGLDLVATVPGQPMLWRENPGSVSHALLNGSGYYTILGDPALDSPMISQIVSFVIDENAPVRVALALKAGSNLRCGQQTRLKISRSQGNKGYLSRGIAMTLPDCDDGGDSLVLKKLIKPMTMAQN